MAEARPWGEEVQEELLAISSIYGEDAVTMDAAAGVCTVNLEADATKLCVGLFLPADYPAASPPLLELSSRRVDDTTLASWAQDVHDLFVPGEPTLFPWLERLRGQLDEWAAAEAVQEESAEEGCAQDTADVDDGPWVEERPVTDWGPPSRAPPDTAAALEVMHGEPCTEKRSTFQAHLAVVHSHAEVKSFRAYLLTIPKIKHATHNIMAYQFRLDSGATAHDCDDDGEHAAGGRMLHLLQMTGAMDVCVVVSRWYGGIQLGPARFTHINNAARQLLDAGGHVAAAGSSKGPRSRKA